jgi:hypothetical protein
MKLDEIKGLLTAVEPQLPSQAFVAMHTFERNGRRLVLAVTERLCRRCQKGRVWKSKAMLTAIKNAEYGFDPQLARSPGGRDGIFLVTRDYQPPNEMMRKLFGQYLDKPDSGAQVVAEALQVSLSSLVPVRLVSHHLRLLGLLHAGSEHDTLVLVDYDDTP